LLRVALISEIRKIRCLYKIIVSIYLSYSLYSSKQKREKVKKIIECKKDFHTLETQSYT